MAFFESAWSGAVSGVGIPWLFGCRRIAVVVGLAVRSGGNATLLSGNVDSVAAAGLFVRRLLAGFCRTFAALRFISDTFLHVYQGLSSQFRFVMRLLGLLYAPFSVLILFVYVMLVVRRLVSLRSLLQPLAGMLLVAVYLWSFCFVFDIPFLQFVEPAKAQWHALSMQPLDKPLLPLLSTAISFLLYVVVAYRMLRTLYNKNILLRRKCVLLFFLSLFFLLLTLLAPADQPVPLFAFWSVLVMVLCEEEGFMKNRFFYNLMFAFLWGIAIVSCF